MSFTEYPASVPWRFYGTGAVIFSQTGTTDFNNGGNVNFNNDGVINFGDKSIQNFVVTAPGDLISSGDGTTLNRLAVGANGQYLSVVLGELTWVTAPGQGPICSVFATGDGSTIGASSSWTTLTSANAYFSSSAVGGVADGAYDEATGIFTVTATGAGVYEVSAIVAFSPANSGGGVDLTASAPAGRATRQIRISDSAGSTVYATAREQAPPSADNPTTVSITSLKLSLNSADTIVLQLRHDANSSLKTLGANRETWFSVSRVR